MAAFIAVSVVMIAAAAGPMALPDFGGLAQLQGREHRREPLCFAAAPRAGRGGPSSRRGYDSDMAGEIGDDQLIRGLLLAASSADGRNSSGRLTG